jgi:hypothetical protein
MLVKSQQSKWWTGVAWDMNLGGGHIIAPWMCLRNLEKTQCKGVREYSSMWPNGFQKCCGQWVVNNTKHSRF